MVTSVRILNTQYSGNIKEYVSDTCLFCNGTFPTVFMRIHVYAAKEGFWPEISIHGVGPDFTRRYNPPLMPVEVLWWTFRQNYH